MISRQNILYSMVFFVSLTFSSLTVFAQNVKVRVEAPEEVWAGDKFRVVYVVEANADTEGEFNTGNFKGLDVLSGPSESVSSSISVVGGKREIKHVRNISYILQGNKEGKYTLPKGEFSSGGKKYKSESAIVRLKLPGKVKNEKKSFVRTIVSRTSVSLGDTLMLTYRLYSTMNFRQILKADYPLINKEFYTNNLTRFRQAVQQEEYEGEIYNVIDLRQMILQPRNLGSKTIPEGSVTIEFGIPTGKKVQDYWGDTYEEIIKEVQTLPVEGIRVTVQNLIEV